MGSRHTRVFVVLVAALALIAGSLQHAEALPAPSLKLIGTDVHQDHIRYRRTEPVYLDMGAWIKSVGGAFELRAKRDANYGPITLQQVDADDPNTVFQQLDTDLMDGWYGLRDFLQLTVTNSATNAVVSDTTTTWCPNSYEQERTGDAGPVRPRYPTYCSGNPFTLGTVWGIDADWAANPMGYDANFVYVPDGSYDVTLKIADEYQALFDIAPADAATESSFTVVTKKKKRRRQPPKPPSHSRTSSQSAFASPPDDDTPDPAWLPDLQALPAWSIGMDNTQTANELTFAATEWNAGPEPMVIEGFRDNTSVEEMQAYQYFYENGQPVARDEAGLLEYHSGGGHDHWHFKQFVAYELISGNDGTGPVVAESGKQAWCLVPTDAIDLTVPGANWRPDNTDLGTSCGSPRSLWVREVLDVGHGDTYYQVSGQAFDVTGLPNGNYQVRITVNPAGAFHESNDANNVSLRDVVISGSGANRTVTVAPYHGIDA